MREAESRPARKFGAKKSTLLKEKSLHIKLKPISFGATRTRMSMFALAYRAFAIEFHILF